MVFEDLLKYYMSLNISLLFLIRIRLYLPIHSNLIDFIESFTNLFKMLQDRILLIFPLLDHLILLMLGSIICELVLM